MNVGFTGTRYGMVPKQLVTMRTQLEALADFITEFHHGDCIGADEQAHKEAQRLRLKIVGHPCDISSMRAFCKFDKELRPKRPLDRNGEIVEMSEILLVAPRGFAEELRSGTWATVRMARTKNIPIILVFTDGSRRIENKSKRLKDLL